MPTLKLSFTKEPESSNANSNRASCNTRYLTHHIKSTDTTKLTTGHFLALQRDNVQLHSPERKKNKFPQAGNLHKQKSNPTQRIQPHPQVRGNTTLQPAERRPQTQQTKQNKKAEKYLLGERT